MTQSSPSLSLIPLLKAIRYVLDQDRLNKSAEEISKVGAELYGEVTRFAESMAKIGNRLKSTVNAYNDAIPGLDRFIVAKSRTLKQLGSGKGAEAELPEAIEIEPSSFLRANSDPRTCSWRTMMRSSLRLKIRSQ
jgi:DNA anti-recombination protein RmuC